MGCPLRRVAIANSVIVEHRIALSGGCIHEVILIRLVGRVPIAAISSDAMRRDNHCVLFARSYMAWSTECAMDVKLEGMHDGFLFDGKEEAGTVDCRAFGYEVCEVIVARKFCSVIEVNLRADGHLDGVVLTDHIAALVGRCVGQGEGRKGEVNR